jgi:hypothetical protein
MRNPLMVLVALAPLAAFAGSVPPAVAESGEGSCVSQRAPPGPLDLDKIPARPVAGPRAIQGVAIDDDECDNEIVREAAGNGFRGAINADDDGSVEGQSVSDD